MWKIGGTDTILGPQDKGVLALVPGQASPGRVRAVDTMDEANLGGSTYYEQANERRADWSESESGTAAAA